MKSLGAILFLLAPLLLLPQAAQAQGDTKIPFAATKPLDTNTQAVVDAGLAALATYDAGAAADITGAVNDGSLDIGELADARFNDFKGLSDGNTLTVRLNDNPDTGELAVRLRHEWYHWKYGVPHGGANGGYLSSCDHFQDYADSYDQIAYMSCDGYTFSCQSISDAMEDLIGCYIDCVNHGGNPPWPSNAPSACCH